MIVTPYRIGQRVVTDFNGRLTTHTIKDVKTPFRSQSGVGYLLDPPQHRGYAPAWIDHAWLSPI